MHYRVYFGRKTGKFVRMFGQWKYKNSQRKMLWNQTEIPTVQTMMSDPYYFSKISLFRFSLIPLTIDNQLWKSAYKMLWFSLSSTFSPCFSTKVNKHRLGCIENISTIPGMGQGGILCPALQKDHQNKPQKLSRFQNPLIPAHITWQKNRALFLLQKTPKQSAGNERSKKKLKE